MRAHFSGRVSPILLNTTTSIAALPPFVIVLVRHDLRFHAESVALLVQLDSPACLFVLHVSANIFDDDSMTLRCNAPCRCKGLGYVG